MGARRPAQEPHRCRVIAALRGGAIDAMDRPRTACRLRCPPRLRPELSHTASTCRSADRIRPADPAVACCREDAGPIRLRAADGRALREYDGQGSLPEQWAVAGQRLDKPASRATAAARHSRPAFQSEDKSRAQERIRKQAADTDQTMGDETSPRVAT